MPIEKTPIKGLTCLNCGQPLRGDENFCPTCGQQNDTRRVSVKEMITHFLGGFFAFDNLFFRTLKPLLLKPGKVTKDYIEGKRKTFTNPFIFLLHSAIVFLIIVPLSDGINTLIYKEKALKEKWETYTVEHTVDSLLNDLKTITLLKNTTLPIQEKENEITKIQDYVLNKIKYKDETVIDSNGLVKITANNNQTHNTLRLRIEKKFNQFGLFYELKTDSTGIKLNEIQPFHWDKSKSKSKNISNYIKTHPDTPMYIGLKVLKLENTYKHRFLYYVHQKFGTIQTLDESDFSQKYLSKIPMSLFVMLPIFSILFTLLYWRHPYKYTEHLIGVFHLQAVFFWVFLVVSLFSGFSDNDSVDGVLFFLAILFFLVYVYRFIKSVYQQSRWKTNIKYFFIITGYFFFFIIGLFIILIIALL